MAKFTISYKWPEYDEGIREAKRTIPAGDVERVCDKFDIGEYLDIELDTVAMTCEVVQRGRLKSEEEYVESTAEWQEERDAEAAEIKAYDDALRDAEEEAKKAGNPPAEVQVEKIYDMSLGAQWVEDANGDLRCPIKMTPRFKTVTAGEKGSF